MVQNHKAPISPRNHTIQKVTNISLSWRELVKRIYESDPLLCSGCGKEMKILGFLTHPIAIRKILKKLGWSLHIPDFDPPQYCSEETFFDFFSPNSQNDDSDLFYSDRTGFIESDHDPPYTEEFFAPTHSDSYIDPPHPDYSTDPPHYDEGP